MRKTTGVTGRKIVAAQTDVNSMKEFLHNAIRRGAAVAAAVRSTRLYIVVFSSKQIRLKVFDCKEGMGRRRCVGQRKRDSGENRSKRRFFRGKLFINVTSVLFKSSQSRIPLLSSLFLSRLFSKKISRFELDYTISN